MRQPKPPAEPHRPSPDDEELRLFREAMQDVRPRPPSQRLTPTATAPDPRPRSFEADEAEALRESLTRDYDDVLIAAGDILDYRAPGLQDSVYRRLKRGQYRVGAELDLHGLNSIRAREAVREFLNDCRARDIRCVRIIHGKGLRSGDAGPVLKRELDGWLRRRRDVLAYHSARREDGGAGAVYVLLSRSG
jgi:DNA-nicking Smr family endonuclease